MKWLGVVFNWTINILLAFYAVWFLNSKVSLSCYVVWKRPYRPKNCYAMQLLHFLANKSLKFVLVHTGMYTMKRSCFELLWNFTFYIVKVYFHSSAAQSLCIAKKKILTFWKFYITHNTKFSLAVIVHLQMQHIHLNELSPVICVYVDGLPQFSANEGLLLFSYEHSRKKLSYGKEKNWPHNEWMCQEFAWST